MEIKQLWGKRFERPPSEEKIIFSAGRDVTQPPPRDVNLIPYDLWVNRVHTIMLTRQGITPRESAAKILRALDEIEELAEQGKFALEPTREDVHTNIEAAVTEKIGIEHAGYMHCGRSRNDQVQADMRLYLRDQAIDAGERCVNLGVALLELAERYADAVMPGFTHHQHAMLTTWGAVLEGWAEGIVRDVRRYLDFLARYNRCPLGGAASYGTTFPIDRELTAQLLGFDSPERSAIDSVATRGEPEAELAFALAATMFHLSQMAQTVIILSMRAPRMLRIADEFAGGSSIMPQKRNPDALEVMKAKAALAGHAVDALLDIGRANLVGYNHDHQWTKYIIMDVVDEVLPAITVMRGVLESLEVRREQMRQWAEKDFVCATALAEALVMHHGVPFRLAKFVVGEAVLRSEKAGSESVTHEALLAAAREQRVELEISAEQVAQYQDPQAAVERISHTGGCAEEPLAQAVLAAREELLCLRGELGSWRQRVEQARQATVRAAREIVG